MFSRKTFSSTNTNTDTDEWTLITFTFTHGGMSQIYIISDQKYLNVSSI